MKKWVAICGFAAGLFFTVASACAANWPSGTVIAKIVGPSNPTPESVVPGYSNLFFTTIEVKETRRYFDPELVGKKIKIITTAFSGNLVGETIPLQLIRTRTNSTFDLDRLVPYRF